jgi:hypothetical protein
MIFDYVAAVGQSPPRAVRLVPAAAPASVGTVASAARPAARPPAKLEAVKVKHAVGATPAARVDAGAAPADPSADLKDPY